jgi:hypothetical protein
MIDNIQCIQRQQTVMINNIQCIQQQTVMINNIQCIQQQTVMINNIQCIQRQQTVMIDNIQCIRRQQYEPLLCLEESEKTTDLSQVSDKLYHIMFHTSLWSRFELTTSVVIGTDCIGSCKSNYHTITATTAPPDVVTICDKVCQWHATGQWFSPGPPVSSNKTDCHDITEILLKVALNTISDSR